MKSGLVCFSFSTCAVAVGLAALDGEFLDYFAAGCLDNLCDRGIAVRLGPIVGMGDHRDPLDARLAHDELAHGGAVSRARRNAVEDALFSFTGIEILGLTAWAMIHGMPVGATVGLTAMATPLHELPCK